MTTPVNPPPQIRIPSKFSGDREVAAWFANNQRVLTQLYKRSGGSSDNGVFLQEQIDQLFLLVGGIDELAETSTGVDYTTISNNIVRVTAPCNITLNLTPEIGERSLIQPQGNFLVTVIGNINNNTEVFMRNAYDLMDVRYTSSGWVII